MVYNQPHRFYCGVDLHARTMFTHVLDHKGKTVVEQDLPADPEVFLRAIQPYRKDLVGHQGDRVRVTFVWDSIPAVTPRHTPDPVCRDWPPGR